MIDCSRFYVPAFFLAAVLPAAAPKAGAAQAPGGTQEAPQAAPAVPPELASPRDTLRTFLEAMNRLESGRATPEAWERVYSTLDLPEAMGEFRRFPAERLLGFFNHLGRIEPETMAPGKEEVERDKLERFEFFPGNPLPAARTLIDAALEEIGTPPPAAVVIEKTASGAWKFSRRTLDRINELYGWIEPRGVRYGSDIGRRSAAESIRRLMPRFLKGRYVIGLEYWQWLGVLALLFIAVVTDFIARLLIAPFAARLLRRYRLETDPESLRFAVRPLGLAAGAIFFLLLLGLLGLTGAALTVLVVGARIVLIVALVWAAWALTDLISKAWIERARTTETTFDDMVIPLVRKSVKLFIVAVGLIYLADSLEISLGPLLASFGLAGLAISFAARNTIENLFGSLTVFLDRPFKIGERVVFRGYDGMIEEIGFRSTRLRTLTGHLVTIPNGLFTSEPIENPGRRPTIRRILNLTITYDTPRAKIEEAVEIVRRIFEEEGIREPIHPVIDGNELPPRVFFNEFNAASLNIFAIYWYHPPDWWAYMEHAHRVNLRIFEEFEKAGIEFAFPTQTLYLAGDPKRELALRLLSQDGRPGDGGAG